VSRLSRQCGILNISQLYRPPRPVTEITLLYGDGVYFLWGTNWTVSMLQVASISQLTVSPLSRQCGILNISQPYRPPWPVTEDSFTLTSFFILLITISFLPTFMYEWNTSVGKETGHWLYDRKIGIRVPLESTIFCTALGSTQFYIKWVRGFFPGGGGAVQH
jgi:hypothetical protein